METYEAIPKVLEYQKKYPDAVGCITNNKGQTILFENKAASEDGIFGAY